MAEIVIKNLYEWIQPWVIDSWANGDQYEDLTEDQKSQLNQDLYYQILEILEQRTMVISNVRSYNQDVNALISRIQAKTDRRVLR